MRRIALTLLFALLSVAGALPSAAQYGKVTGVVREAGTQEPLPGVNVQIEGTTLGAVTDVDGNYVIIGVRPGTYTVAATYIGYQPTRTSNVRVQIDQTATVDFILSEGDIQGQEIEVVAERPVVQRDVTATTAAVSREEIAALPVENVADVIGLQAGVVNGHFRGGRSGEVGYWVDGLPVTDVFDGGLGVQVENDMIQELQVVTGAFNAEYGQALSGIVNVVTRDGDDRYAGSISGFAGDYVSTGDRYFPGIRTVSPAAVRNVEGNVSGPVRRGKLWFFTNARYFGNDGTIVGNRAYRFGDIGFDPTGRIGLLEPGGSGDSSAVALNPYERASGQFKLTYRATPMLRFAANVIGSRETSKNGDYAYLLMPDGLLNQSRSSLASYLKMTHTLSNRTFYEFGLTRNENRYRQYLFDDVADERYMDNEVSGFSDYLTTAGFVAGGTNNNRFSRKTVTWLGKADLTSQVNRTNMVKTGLEFRRHDLTFNDDYVTVNDQLDTSFVATNGRYAYQPIEASGYVQDKIEVGGFIMNVGLRFDYFDSNGKVLRSLTDPEALFLERRLAGQSGAADYTPEAYFTDAKPKFQVSPRIGVAFPISSTGVIHFSYGQFFQTPNFELLYQNPYFQLGSGGSGLVGLIGNADLKPEQTISGEIGLKQGITETSAVELTAYYRDIRNLTGTATDPILIEGTSARYGRLVNSDFGFVRGIIARYDLRIGYHLFAGVDYTFQVARANASDPSQAYNAAAARGQIETQIVPTSWDQRHTANLSLTYSVPRNWGFGLLINYGSGEPYTPSVNTLQSGAIVPSTVPLNSEIKPAIFNASLTAQKDFRIGRSTAQVFTKIDNLFDRRNEYGVFGETGRATYSLQKAIDARTFRGNPLVLDRAYNRPYYFNEPRRVVVGLTFTF